MMGNMEYIRECGVNYLRYQLEEAVDYRMEMLIQNQVEGFLPIELRRMDEWEWIYCRISGMISLSQCLERSRLGERELTGFLESAEGLCRRMEEYLLPFEGLVLKPEHIYVRPGDMRDYYWVYGCGEEAAEETSSGEELLEYLLDHLDYEDQKAVKLLYAVYQSCRGSGGDIAAIRGAYQKVTGRGEPEELLEARAAEAAGWEGRVRRIYPEGNAEPKISGRTALGQEVSRQGIYERELADRSTESGLEEKRYAKRNIPRKGLSYLEMEEGQEASGYHGSYVQEESAWVTGNTFPDKKKDSEEAEKNSWTERLPGKIKEVYTTLFGGGEDGKSKEKEPNRQKDSKKPKGWNFLERKQRTSDGLRWREERLVRAKEPPEEEKSAGTTLLTGGMMGGGIYCLRAQNRGDADLLLTSYPFFIGKDESKMDGVVEDAFVSRYHARIDREEDGFRVLDLGSTNGTFVNRERLEPYEARVIQEGDRVSFAHKEYEFCFLL